MTFEVDGQKYRIGFSHDKPKDWESHAKHELRLCQRRPPKSVGGLGSPLELWCDRCQTFLAGMSPAIARKLATDIPPNRIVRSIVEPSTAALARRELARNAHCIIYRREGDKWVSLYSGSSRLNTDAGDTYEREKGRIAALRDALPIKPREPARPPGGPDNWSADARRAYNSAHALYRSRRALYEQIAVRQFNGVASDCSKFCHAAMAAYLERYRETPKTRLCNQTDAIHQAVNDNLRLALEREREAGGAQ